ncbi:hypothetical protein PV326_006087 [Microctonus aethiopoides]|nr:hypothetical protein PV326_006087 [Microctonus aethiopoides]
MTKENAMKFKRASSKVAIAPPATFRFGPSGISSGLLVNQQIRRDFGPRKSAAPMRSMTRLRQAIILIPKEGAGPSLHNIDSYTLASPADLVRN